MNDVYENLIEAIATGNGALYRACMEALAREAQG